MCPPPMPGSSRATSTPGFVVTNQTPLKNAPRMYQKFRDKQDCVIKVVLHPAT